MFAQNNTDIQSDPIIDINFDITNINNVPSEKLIALAELMKTRWVQTLQLLLTFSNIFVTANEHDHSYRDHISTADKNTIMKRSSLFDNLNNIIDHTSGFVLAGRFPETCRFEHCLAKIPVPKKGYFEKQAETDEFLDSQIASMIDNGNKLNQSTSVIRKNINMALEFENTGMVRLQRHLSNIRNVTIRFDFEMNTQQSKEFCEELLTKKGVVSIETVKPAFVDIRFKGATNSLSRPHGYIKSALNVINFETNFETRVWANLPPVEINKKCSSESTTLYTLLYMLMRNRCISQLTAKTAMFNVWKDPEELEAFKMMLTKLSNKRKNAPHKKKVLDDVELFSNENLCKSIVKYDTPIYIYFSNHILDVVKTGDFDTMFIDGTHIKNSKGSQLILVRLFSTANKKVLTACYIITQSKKTEAYVMIFKKLGKLKFLDNIKHVMTDFEIAFRNALNTVFPAKFEYHFCFFHLQNATRNYAASINRVGRKLNQCKTTPYIHTYFSYLVFSHFSTIIKAFEFLVAVFRLNNINAADEVFFDYFKSTYINSKYIDCICMDPNKFKCVTNNTVEGVNSGMKRFVAGRNSVPSILDWLAFDAKTYIISSGNNTDFKEVEQYVCIQNAMLLDQNWLILVAEKVQTLGKNSEKTRDDSLAFSMHIGKFQKIQIRKDGFKFIYKDTIYTNDTYPSGLHQLSILNVRDQKEQLRLAVTQK